MAATFSAPVTPIKPGGAATPAPSSGGGYSGLLQSASAPVDTRQILQTAHAQALQNTQSVAQGYQAQQAAIQQQAAQEAQNVESASGAAAKLLQGLHQGTQLANSYRSAANDQAGLAAGFSGQLQRTVGDESAQASKGLAALGSPGALPSTAGQAGNAVYALGGQIPANAMLANAPAAVAEAQGAVRGLVGYGQQQAIGTLGAGQQAANKLTPSILAAEAKTPALTQQYASQLLTAAEKDRQDAIGNAYKAIALDQAGQKDAAEAAYQKAEVGARLYATKVQDAHNVATENTTSAHNAAIESIQQQNANTSRERATTAANRSIIVGSDKSGRYAIDPATGRRTLVTPPVKATPSASSMTSLVKDTNAMVAKGASGKAPEQHYAPTAPTGQQVTDASGNPTGFITVPGTGTGATTYSDAVRAAIANGPNTPAWRQRAIKIVDAHYEPGENGRPYTPTGARRAATAAAAAAYSAALPVDTAIKNIVTNSGGTLSPEVVKAAVTKVYYINHARSPINGLPPSAVS